MTENQESLTPDQTFQFVLSQLNEIERNIRHNEMVHGSQEKFFLSLLSALMSIGVALVAFNVSTETRLVTLSSSILSFLLIFILAYIVSLVFLVLKIERRIVTYEWIERAIQCRGFFINLNPKMADFYELPYRLEDAPEYWPSGYLGKHPLFKVSLAVYIIINSLIGGIIAFALTYHLTKIHVCSLITSGIIIVFVAFIEWLVCRDSLHRRDRDRLLRLQT